MLNLNLQGSIEENVIAWAFKVKINATLQKKAIDQQILCLEA